MNIQYTPGKSPLHLIAIAAMLTAFALPAGASIIAYENFEVPAGSLNGRGSGDGWDSNWVGGTSSGQVFDVQSGTFTTPSGYSLNPGNSYLELTSGTTAAQLNRSLAVDITLNPEVTTTYYFSALASFLNDGSANDAKYLPRFVDSNNSALVSFGVGGDNRTRINIGSSTTGANITEGSSFADAAQYLAVGKMVLNPSGTEDAFYFTLLPVGQPVSYETEPTWTVTRTADLSGMIAGVAFYSASNAGTLNVDNFILGSTFTSVIPEPSTYALLAGGLSLLAIGFRRFRRKAVAQ